MKKSFESVVGLVLGLVIGLPQGLGKLPEMINKPVSHDTFIVLLVFGAIAGIALTIGLLDKRNDSIGGYIFFLVGSLSIGIPQLLKNWSGLTIESFTLPSLFFSVIGLTMFLSGGIYLVFRKTT